MSGTARTGGAATGTHLSPGRRRVASHLHLHRQRGFRRFLGKAGSSVQGGAAMALAALELSTSIRETRPFTPQLEPVDRVDPSELVLHSKQYRVVRELGEGGMGVVYQAYDAVLERDVALKVMKVGLPGSARQRFRQEALYGARLCHPNLARVYDLGFLPDRGLDWFAMEFLRGKDLERLLTRAREREVKMSPRIVAHVFDGILDALEYAHRHGVVHRDVKPGNIFVSRDPVAGRLWAKLLDFGVAVDIRRSGQPGEICGDPRYIAPEQALAHRPLDGRTDVYAAGLTLFETMTGRHPFEDLLFSPSRELIAAQCERPLPCAVDALPDALPKAVRCGLDVVLTRACAKDPERRFDSAADMRTALLDVLIG
jgi:serine/threonine protein kinase